MGDVMRKASCHCGQFVVWAEGDPVAVGMCHCLDCQRRTGSVFGVQGRFLKEKVRIIGPNATYERKGESGRSVTFYFCPRCGSNLCWEPEALPEHISVAVGAFADPAFPQPNYSVYEARQHAWAHPTFEIEHYE